MNNLLFYSLLIILIYYFFFYLPTQKKLTTTHQFTQTDPIPNTELEQLKTNLKDKDLQITNLQSQIRDLAKRPLKPTNSKSTQTDELTNTLDNLIKEVQNLNNSLN